MVGDFFVDKTGGLLTPKAVDGGGPGGDCLAVLPQPGRKKFRKRKITARRR